MKDMRMDLIKSIEFLLSDYLESDEIVELSDKITLKLNDYEIIERCTDVVPVDTTNEKIIKLFCASLLVDGKSPKTIYQYRRMAIRLCDFLGKPIPEMGPYDIRFYLATEKQRGVSERSVENTRSYLSAMFTWLTNEEIISKNPMRNIKPVAYKDEIRLPFSEVEIDRIRSACKDLRERAIIEVLLATGVRVSELSQMEVKDINPSKFEVNVVHGKGGFSRTTYITPVALVHLEAYLNARPEKEGVFLFYNNNHKVLAPGGIRYILRNLGERANVKGTKPHRFRRSFSCTLAKRGMDIRKIQKLMGHKNINTTMCYIYTEDEDVKASYRKYIS